MRGGALTWSGELAGKSPEGGPSGASGLRPADLGFGAVDAQCDVFGLGAGEHVGQGDQQPVGEHQLEFWLSAGLAPPVARRRIAPPTAARVR